MKNKSKEVAFAGISVALALILAYVETLLPPLFVAVPGIKMGLPNIVIIFLLYRRGPAFAGAVSFIRIFLVALLFGNAASLIYSVSGGIFSFVAMLLLRKMNLFSTVGVSVAGGVMHNVGQILAAAVLLNTEQLGYYLAVLAVSGTVAGVFIGLCGTFLVKRVPEKV